MKIGIRLKTVTMVILISVATIITSIVLKLYVNKQ